MGLIGYEIGASTGWRSLGQLYNVSYGSPSFLFLLEVASFFTLKVNHLEGNLVVTILLSSLFVKNTLARLRSCRYCQM
jgi:hypothetical protein